PQVVAFAGTLGLKILISAYRDAPWTTVGVVPPANAGAAFAQLHSSIGATADEVLIPTLDRVEVCAELSDHTFLAGEAAITQGKPGATIQRVFLISEVLGRPSTDFRPTPEVLAALERADAIVIGPGSLFTNLIPTLLIKEINEAIRQSKARKIFICNLMTQPNQTEGYSVADHVRAIQRHCGFRLDYVLAHRDGVISPEVLERYRSTSADLVTPHLVLNDGSQVAIFPDTPQEMVLVEGAILIQRNLATEVLEPDPLTGEMRLVVRHDPQKLGEALRSLLMDYALQKQLSVSRAIFREYDIRGIVGDELTTTVLESMGRAFGTYVQRRTGRKQIVVGHDCRPSSGPFSDAAIRGLMAAGCEVLDIGQVPTPLTSFAVNHFWVDAVVQVTASHNPAEFNGLKLQIGMEPLAGEELQKVERIIASNAFASGEGRRLARDVVYPYLNCILHRIELSRPLKVAVDAGNGVSGPLALQLLRELGCEVFGLYCEPDGTFPNHTPDPTEPENLVALQELVRREGCDVGIAFDGDGDRIGLVDEKGHIIPPDITLLLFAREALRPGPGKVVFEVRCSEMIFDGVRKYGGIPVMARCGNTSILPRMRQERAVLGGELSGHIFFNDPPFEFDDALYAAALLLKYMDRAGRPLSEMIADLLHGLPRYVSSPEIRIDCPDYLKFDIVDAVREQLARRYRVIDIDGARVYFGESDWALIRASNTSPKLSLRFEGRDEASVQRMKEEMRKLLAPYLPGLKGL
ncbi:MAG: YvcK family protein, partial [Chloroflexi bacterium]|nr:YvcK family protein [Chloroflexota bacterium]